MITRDPNIYGNEQSCKLGIPRNEIPIESIFKFYFYIFPNKIRHTRCHEYKTNVYSMTSGIQDSSYNIFFFSPATRINIGIWE